MYTFEEEIYGNFEPHQNFIAPCEKSVEVLDELQDTENIERQKSK